jgi:hypothetical protein
VALLHARRAGLDALVLERQARIGGLFRSLDAPNPYFPGVGLDGIGAAPWVFSLFSRTIMSHIQGRARLGDEVLGHKVNHFDIVEYLAPRDPGRFEPDGWRAQYRTMALETPDERPYPIP